jgi:hypothetical protein
MKWVALATASLLALYTFLTLSYRKPATSSHEPYREAKQRATIARLESAGYSRIYASADRPADPTSAAAAVHGPFSEVSTGPGGLDEELKRTLIDQPVLPPRVSDVHAPREAHVMLPYTVQFTCTSANNKQLLSGTYVYVRDQSIMIVPDFEKIAGDLLARTPQSVVEVTIPPGTLGAGTYHATLVGSEESRRWDVQVH